MNEPSPARPSTILANLEALREQLERLGREPGRLPPAASGPLRPTRQTPWGVGK